MLDIFALREEYVSEHGRFSRSFTNIRAEDILQAMNEAYAGGRSWPAPLIQLNPNLVPAGPIDDLVSKGTLDEECAKVFRLKRPPDTFGKQLAIHQYQAATIRIAGRDASRALTTGTGSVKSLSYFIPIVESVLRRKKDGDPCRVITAIVVDPTNALCNSQLEELAELLRLCYCEAPKGPPPGLRVDWRTAAFGARESGSACWARTSDKLINSQLLYQLS